MIVPKTKHHDELGRSTRHSYEANGGGVLPSPALDISYSEPTKSHYYSRYDGSGLYRLCGQPILRMTVVCSVYCTLRVSPVGYALFSPTKKADPFGRLLNMFTGEESAIFGYAGNRASRYIGPWTTVAALALGW